MVQTQVTGLSTGRIALCFFRIPAGGRAIITLPSITRVQGQVICWIAQIEELGRTGDDVLVKTGNWSRASLAIVKLAFV